MHQVVESRAVLEEVVDSTEDAEDAKREDPDSDNSHDRGFAGDEEAENTEAGGDDIDNQNGTGQLPGRNGRPEWSVGTSDEDQPVLGQGDFQEQDRVDVSEVLDNTATNNLDLALVVGIPVKQSVSAQISATKKILHCGQSNPSTKSQSTAKQD